MFRVREVLGDSDFCRKLRGKLPKEAMEIPDCKKPLYPSSVVKELPEDNYCSKYSYLGIITEELLQSDIIDKTNLSKICFEVTNVRLTDKTLNSSTTSRFIENIKNTKNIINSLTENDGIIYYNKSITRDSCKVEGHPDILTNTQIFEIKTTGQLKKNWNYFLLQTFAYAALCPSATKIHIVLPLSEFVWTWDTKNNWPKKELFFDIIAGYNKETTSDHIFFNYIINEFRIGSHILKKKKLYSTVLEIEDSKRPYQIFFTKSADFNIEDIDIAETLNIINNKGIKLFIHSPYLLNLCIEPGTEDNYVVNSLTKHLRYANSCGAKGVVVHVGKSCNKNLSEALSNMTLNILTVLEAATINCPLLLETPAGQGTEVLTNIKDMLDFMSSIDDDRFGLCIDTCHVFASGINPMEYIETFIKNIKYRKYIKLVHFNDSKGECGSCVDRHAQLGSGLIGKEELINCAKICSMYNIPMLIE
jgi:deoxyribonuclease-4